VKLLVHDLSDEESLQTSVLSLSR